MVRRRKGRYESSTVYFTASAAAASPWRGEAGRSCRHQDHHGLGRWEGREIGRGGMGCEGMRAAQRSSWASCRAQSSASSPREPACGVGPSASGQRPLQPLPRASPAARPPPQSAPNHPATSDLRVPLCRVVCPPPPWSWSNKQDEFIVSTCPEPALPFSSALSAAVAGPPPCVSVAAERKRACCRKISSRGRNPVDRINGPGTAVQPE